MIFDVDKISLREAFNNDNGKTSANKIVGVITSFICMILVISLIIFYFFNTGEATIILALIDKTITYFACAAALMGVKSLSNAVSRRNSVINTINPYQPTNIQLPTPLTTQYVQLVLLQYQQQLPLLIVQQLNDLPYEPTNSENDNI